MNRQQALQYVAYTMDDSLNYKPGCHPVDNMRLVGFAAGAEPLVIAVYSYLPNVRIGDTEAEELATDLLLELGWFSGPVQPAIFIL